MLNLLNSILEPVLPLTAIRKLPPVLITTYNAVAKAPNGKWIYLFTPDGNKFTSEKLVNMKHHQYKLEPNVHFSPDGKWIHIPGEL